ncbi:MAG: hypothetical protein ACLFVQ_07000 [Chitinispirillaceae bacterium]
MLKRLMPVLALGALFSVQAQTEEVKADSVNYDKPSEWKLIASTSPVKAFALQGNILWYATDETVVAQPMNSKNHQQHAKLGTIPSAGVTSIVVDGAGKVWFGTPAGLASRSGSKFTSYTTENGLPDNSVLAVAAHGSDVWVGTENGAALFKDGAWKTFTTEDGLVSNKVQAVVVDAKGTAWLGTDKGISAFDGTKWTNHTMQNGLSWNDTKVLGLDKRKNQIWAAVGEMDINCWTGSEWKTYLEIQEGLTSIMSDPHRTWFGSGSGLLRFNGDIWTSDPKSIGIPAAQVFQMHEDAKGNLWFAMEKGVLCLSNPYR